MQREIQKESSKTQIPLNLDNLFAPRPIGREFAKRKRKGEEKGKKGWNVGKQTGEKGDQDWYTTNDWYGWKRGEKGGSKIKKYRTIQTRTLTI